jgi:hypothetical protein
MHETKKEILKCFVRNNSTPLSTSEIVEMVYGSELNKAESSEHNFTESHAKEQQKKYLRLKAQLHRKILHHINGLILDDLLVVQQTTNKGQKVYLPKVEPNQEVVLGKTDRIILSAQTTPLTPISQYEEDDAIEQFSASSWVQKINAILLESAHMTDMENFQKVVSSSLHVVNDVVGINDFESIIQSTPLPQIRIALDYFERECQIQKKRLCLIVDLTNVTNDSLIYEWFLQFVKQKALQTTVIIDATHREMMLHKTLLEKTVLLFKEYQLKFNIKNDENHKAPYIIGRAGPYTISEEEWQEYIKKTYAKSFGIALTQSTVIVDFYKLIDKKYSAKDIEKIFFDIAKSLFIANSIQRKNARTILQTLPQTVVEKRLFLSYSHTLIRLKNILKLLDKQKDSQHIVLLDQIVEKIEHFAKNQEFIYFSCGMPLRFKINLSQSYKHADKQQKIDDDFVKIRIEKSDDFFTPEYKLLFSKLEQMKKYVIAFETRIERKNNFVEKDIIGEILLLSSTYNLPFICYKFDEVQKEIPLTKFMKISIGKKPHKL